MRDNSLVIMEGMLLNYLESVSNELTDIRGVCLNHTFVYIRSFCAFIPYRVLGSSLYLGSIGLL